MSHPREYDCMASKTEQGGAGREVLERLNKLAAYAEMVADQVCHKLEPIVIQTPEPPRGGTVSPARVQPPLFDAMTNQAERIERFIGAIESVIRRVDL